MTRRQSTTTAPAEFVARLIAEMPRAVGAELAREAMALTDALACGSRLANPGGSWCQRLRGPGPLCISVKPDACFDTAELTLASPGYSRTRAFVVGAQSRTDP